MKNTLMLIVILIAQLSFCQTINTTPEQDQKIKELATPENFIEWSKGLSNEKKQADVIYGLEEDVLNLKQIIEALYTENTNHLNTIVLLNKSIEDNTKAFEKALKEEKQLFKTQLRKQKVKSLKIGGIGLIAVVLGVVIAK